MRRLALYVLPAAACVALALVLANMTPAPSPGTLGSSTPAPDFVDTEQLAQLPVNGPRRAVLEWWRAEQDGNARGGYALLSRALRARVSLLSYGRKLGRSTMGFVGKLYLTGAVQHGERATVQAVVVALGSTGPGLAYRLSFPVVREGNRWRLASIDYLNINDRAKAAPARPMPKRPVPKAARQGV